MKLYNIASQTISWLQLVNHLLYYKIIWLKSFLVPLISHCVLSPHGICGSCSYTFVDYDFSYAHDSTLCTWSVWHTIKRSANIFILFCQPSSSLGGRTLACLERRLLWHATWHRCGRRGRENKRVVYSDAHRTSAVRFTPLGRHLRWTHSSYSVCTERFKWSFFTFSSSDALCHKNFFAICASQSKCHHMSPTV